MSFNIKVSEAIAVLGAINPVSQAAGSVASAWLPAAQFQKFLGLVQVGAFGADATVDADLMQAQDSNGTGAKAIGDGKAIQQLLAAGGNNVQAEIDLDAQELDVNNGYCYIQLTITVGEAATLVAGAVFGGGGRLGPASDFNAASVVQTVD